MDQHQHQTFFNSLLMNTSNHDEFINNKKLVGLYKNCHLHTNN